MKTLKIITAILIATFALSHYTFAQDQRISYEKNNQNQNPPRPDFSKLNLTQEQQAQITLLEEEQKTIMQPLHEKMREKDNALRILKQSENASKSELKKLYNERCIIQSELDAERDIFHQKIQTVLTAEQLNELKKMRPPKPTKQF